MTNDPNQTKTQAAPPAAASIDDSPMRKFDAPVLRSMEATALGMPVAAFLPASMAQAMELGKLMAASNFVPPHLRGKAGDCLAVVLVSTRWAMDPFSVASKTYFVSDRIAYEAQLVSAVINTRAPLQRRLRYSYEGDGPTRKCTVSGLLRGEDHPHDYTTPTLGSIGVKNSPLWKSDPDQQLAYYATRAWARRHVSEVLMGVYTPDEIENHEGPDNARDITPQGAGARPKRSDFDPITGEVIPKDMLPVMDAWGKQITLVDPSFFASEFSKQAAACNYIVELEALYDHNQSAIDQLGKEADTGPVSVNAIFDHRAAQLQEAEAREKEVRRP